MCFSVMGSNDESLSSQNQSMNRISRLATCMIFLKKKSVILIISGPKGVYLKVISTDDTMCSVASGHRIFSAQRIYLLGCWLMEEHAACTIKPSIVSIALIWRSSAAWNSSINSSGISTPRMSRKLVIMLPSLQKMGRTCFYRQEQIVVLWQMVHHRETKLQLL